MRSRSTLIAVAVLLFASFSFLIGEELPDYVEGKTVIAPDDYHNATIHFNVTLPGGQPAAGFRVEVRNTMAQSNRDDGIMDSAGKLKLYVNFMTLGICEIRIFDLTPSSVHYEKLDIWPDEVLNKVITVGEPLEWNNRLYGVLRNASNNAPIPFYKIYISGMDSYGAPHMMYNVTDHLGRYSFDLPNASTDYLIYPEGTGDYGNFNIEIFLEKDVYDHPRDLFLKPRYRPLQPTHLRIKDVRSGEFRTQGKMWISGYADAYENAQYSTSASSTDVHTGWFNTSLDPGEYYAYWSPDVIPGVPYFDFNNYFYVNDTETFHEIPVYLPEYIDLVVEVWNDTSPIQDSFTYWYDHSGENGISCYAYSNSLGITRMKVPSDRVIKLDIDRPDHIGRSIEVDPTGMTSPIRLNITLEKKPTFRTAEANVTVRVVDDITGIGIPYATIRMDKYSGYSSFGNSYTANVTGVLEEVVVISEMYLMYSHFNFKASSNIGEGEIKGAVLNEGPNPEIVIRVTRYELEEPYVRSHFYVKDESGTPIPDLKLQVTMYGDVDSIWAHTVTDDNGRVELVGPTGEYRFTISDSIKHMRNFWALGNPTIEVKEAGPLGDITVYPTHPLETLWGFVKDAGSLETISNVRIYSRSVKELEETRSGWRPKDEQTNEISLFTMSSGTDQSGYFRTDGRDIVKLRFSKNGYFNKKTEIEQGTRAVKLEDVFLEPITEFSLWVNGTLVNENGEPIEGWMYVYDKDHDDHELYDRWVNETGEFSFPMYPGNFIFFFTNYSLEGLVDITVGPEGIEDLTLALIPTSEVWGYVLDWNGEPLSGMNVTLINYDINEPGTWQLTDEFGEFTFEVPAGNYYLVIQGTEIFDEFMGPMFEMNGWDDEYFEITMDNRSLADIIGKVYGEAGPLVDGVPGAFVSLMSDGEEVENATCNSTGYYEFLDVEHGMNYSLMASPPEEWMPVEGLRSGYLMNTTVNLTVTGALLEVDIILPYEEHEPPGYLEILEYLPISDNVFLDEPIVVRFSHTVNASTFMQAFSIEPEVQNLTYSWRPDSLTMLVYHDDLEANTSYTVSIGSSVVSAEGWPLADHLGVTWNFTTSDSLLTWKILSVDVSVGIDKGVEFNVQALDGMDIYVVIDGVGSFQFIEDLPGRYFIEIDEENFEWSTTYSYHLSDEAGGGDKAVGYSGTFTTPEEPSVEWDLTASIVNAEDDGSISVEARGPPGLTIWIDIEGVGWYQLEEMESGIYRTTVPAGDLDLDTTYNYHYSDRENGEDLKPEHGGSIKTVEEPVVSDDDTTTSTFGRIMVYSLSCCGIVLLLIFIVLIIMLVARRRPKEEGLDEE